MAANVHLTMLNLYRLSYINLVFIRIISYALFIKERKQDITIALRNVNLYTCASPLRTNSKQTVSRALLEKCTTVRLEHEDSGGHLVCNTSV